MAEKRRIISVSIGHVDSGKSTTLGHLACKCGAIDQTKIEQFEKEAKLIGKESFKYAWVFDKLKAERERGITIDTSIRQLETNKCFFTLIDAPGHRDYIQNMINAASQAQIGLLVVSATSEEFEAGIERNGQIWENLALAKALGIKQLIVCVNKLDTESFDESRFNDIKKEVQTAVLKNGYPNTTPFIPISGWTGCNLIEKSTHLDWWEGPTLLEVLEAIVPPRRDVTRPLRVPIHDVYKIQGVGTVAVGCVATGLLAPGLPITFSPNQLTSEVKSVQIVKENKNIESDGGDDGVEGDASDNDPTKECAPVTIFHENIDKAESGDYVGFQFEAPSGEEIRRGHVASDSANDPAKECEYFIAQVTILNHPGEIHPGYCPVVDCHTAHIACKWTEFVSLVARSGKPTGQVPQVLKNSDCALVKMFPEKPMCVETFEQFPPLGRITVRDMKRVIAVGVITQVQKKQ